MAEVKVKFSADTSEAIQSIKRVERANAEAAKGGGSAQEATARARDAQNALLQAKAARSSAAAAQKEVEQQIRVQAATVAAARAALQAADTKTEAGKQAAKAYDDELKKLNELKAAAKAKKGEVTAAEGLIGRAQSARSVAMSDVSAHAAARRQASAVPVPVSLRDRTAAGFRRILARGAATARGINTSFNAAASRIGGAFSGLRGMFAGAAAVVGVQMSIAALKSEIDRMDNTAKQARGLNMTGEELQVLQYACRSANVPVEALTAALPRVAKTAADAAAGSADAAAKLARLGLTADDLKGKSGYEQLQIVARAINSIGDHSERTAVAMDFFGKSGAKMLDMLTGIASAEAEARAQGVIISDEQLANAEKFNQSLENIRGNIVGGLMNSGFVGWLSDVAEGFNAWASNEQRMQQGGVYDRQHAVQTVLDEAVASGKMSREEADQLAWNDAAKGGGQKWKKETTRRLNQMLREGGFADLANGAAMQARTQPQKTVTRAAAVEEAITAAEKRGDITASRAAELRAAPADAPDRDRQEIAGLLKKQGYGKIAEGAAEQAVDPAVQAAAAKKADREAEARKREQVRQQAAEEEANNRALADMQKHSLGLVAEFEALDNQLADLQKRNTGKQTKEDYVKEQVDRARKAAPGAFDEARRSEIEAAAGAAYDRGEAEEQARKEAGKLREQLRAPGQEAMQYRGDAVSRLGGTLGGALGADRAAQSQQRIAENQLATARGILERLNQLKIEYPQIFK